MGHAVPLLKQQSQAALGARQAFICRLAVERRGTGTVLLHSGAVFITVAQVAQRRGIALVRRLGVPCSRLRPVLVNAGTVFITEPQVALGAGQTSLCRSPVPADGRSPVLVGAAAAFIAPAQIALGLFVAAFRPLAIKSHRPGHILPDAFAELITPAKVAGRAGMALVSGFAIPADSLFPTLGYAAALLTAKRIVVLGAGKTFVRRSAVKLSRAGFVFGYAGPVFIHDAEHAGAPRIACRSGRRIQPGGLGGVLVHPFAELITPAKAALGRGIPAFNRAAVTIHRFVPALGHAAAVFIQQAQPGQRGGVRLPGRQLIQPGGFGLIALQAAAELITPAKAILGARVPFFGRRRIPAHSVPPALRHPDGAFVAEPQVAGAVGVALFGGLPIPVGGGFGVSGRTAAKFTAKPIIHLCARVALFRRLAVQIGGFVQVFFNAVALLIAGAKGEERAVSPPGRGSGVKRHGFLLVFLNPAAFLIQKAQVALRRRIVRGSGHFIQLHRAGDIRLHPDAIHIADAETTLCPGIFL